MPSLASAAKKFLQPARRAALTLPGMADHLVHRRDLAGPTIFHHTDAAAVAVTLIAVVADPEDGAVERREQVGKLDLKIPL